MHEGIYIKLERQKAGLTQKNLLKKQDLQLSQFNSMKEIYEHHD